MDIIPEDRALDGYKILIVPQMIITKPETERKIKEFAENGGTVIMTYRCAVKDCDNNIPFGKTMPVNYNHETGITVVETESLQEYDAFPLTGCGDFAGITGKGGIFRDMIETVDAEILFKYGDEFYSDFAAVTRKRNAKGAFYYIGCGLNEELTKMLTDTVMREHRIETTPSPDGVEVVSRGSGSDKIRMIINHNAKKTEFGSLTLAPFECKIECV